MTCRRATQRPGLEGGPFCLLARHSRHGLASGVTYATEPAVLSAQAAHLQELLGLSDEELLAVLDADPLAVITGELDHKPELPILLDLLAEAEERAGAPVLRRWVRAAGPAGRPARPAAGARLRRASRTRWRRSPSAGSCCARASRPGPGCFSPGQEPVR